MTWTQGRRLASITQNGITTSYEYNVNGIRTKKTVGEEVYNMLLSDDTLIGVGEDWIYITQGYIAARRRGY